MSLFMVQNQCKLTNGSRIARKGGSGEKLMILGVGITLFGHLGQAGGPDPLSLVSGADSFRVMLEHVRRLMGAGCENNSHDIKHQLTMCNFRHLRQWITIMYPSSLTLSELIRFTHIKVDAANQASQLLEWVQGRMSETPVGHPDRPAYLVESSGLLGRRYEETGDLKDRDAAIQTTREALELFSAHHPTNKTHVVHPDRPLYLSKLRELLSRRYLKTRNLKDLDEAIHIAQWTLKLISEEDPPDKTPAGHPERRVYLIELSKLLGQRCIETTDLQDLDGAIHAVREALKLLSAEDPLKEMPARHPGRQVHRRLDLSRLIRLLRHKYRITRNLQDLDVAIHTAQEALEHISAEDSPDKTPAGNPEQQEYLTELSKLLGQKYVETSDLRDLKASIKTIEKALNIVSINPESSGSLLPQDGVMSEQVDEIMPAARAAHEGNLTAADRHDRAARLQSLSELLASLYKTSNDPHDMQRSIQHGKEALELTPVDDSYRASRIQQLASCFQLKHSRMGDPKDLQAMHQLYDASFKTQTLPESPEESWRAAISWDYYSFQFQHTHVPAAWVAAFQLLPDILWIGDNLSIRQNTIRRLNLGYATSSATTAWLGQANVPAAIETLEQGIGTIFQQILQLKPDTSELPPEKAKKLQEISSKLYQETTDELSSVASQRKKLLQEIRSQPGLESFLRPKTYKALAQASQGGPVVILSTYSDHSDVMIILNPTSDPVHLQFDNVSREELNAQRTILKELLRRCNVRRRGESVSTRLFGMREGFTTKTTEEGFAELLAWLWMNVVGPVYEALKSNGVTNGRLWWLPTGEFTGLPLHASSPTSQFIHSYTAALGSLLEAYVKKPSKSPPKLSVVAVTHTGPGGRNYLKEVAQEARKIRSVVSDIECLEGEQATPDAVQRQLQDCSWAHFACHGMQDLEVPNKSHLLLYGGALELGTILKMPLSNAQVVFLAACQTAMGDTELINESFHLGGGFITAGFRGAIGTLWSMNDGDGPFMAETVYSELFKLKRQPRASDAAAALHLAVQELRARNVPYERWVPFIHMGI
ncbi:CHAT domain-containing protein [Mycena maculata]|uniref:CHAT domain-containing protein n=1 Tax=Mycena maculata TaxID=230809 RepID=A0AAD7K0E2_9AGAR|nr:CHAT domain-containing protein [Mycena maculata]